MTESAPKPITARPPVPPPPSRSGGHLALARGLAVLATLFVFLMGVKGLGDGFKLLGRDMLEAFFVATDNPFFARPAKYWDDIKPFVRDGDVPGVLVKASGGRVTA